MNQHLNDSCYRILYANKIEADRCTVMVYQLALKLPNISDMTKIKKILLWSTSVFLYGQLSLDNNKKNLYKKVY